MWGQQFTSLVLVLGLTNFSHALPGIQAHGCPDKINGVYQDSCSNTASTTLNEAATFDGSNTPSTITSAPSVIVQAYRREAETVTAVCNFDECSVFDVSSVLITVFPLPDVTVFPLPNVTNRPRPPFANGTEVSQPHSGPTASGTGIVSGTGVAGTSTDEINGTTTITSRVTVSILTVTAGNWSDWTSAPMGTGATGRQPYNSANATTSHHSVTASHWSFWPMPTGSPYGPSSMSDNLTYVSSGQTFTRAPISPPSSSCPSNGTTCSTTSTFMTYVTTNTYIFSGSTVIIPVPAGYGSSSTSSSHPTKTHTPEHTTASLVGGRISTSSCWTTSGKSTSGTETATITASSKICWILSCDDEDNCTDHVSRYPITVDAQSTSHMTSYGNSTVMATTTTSSNGSVFATVMPTSEPDTMWMTWSTGHNATAKHSSSHSTSKSISSHPTSSSHTHSVDATTISSSSTSAFESTYPSWMGWSSTADIDTLSTHSSTSNDPVAHPSISVEGTMTRTMSPLFATTTAAATSRTTDAGFYVRNAMMNRKRYLRGQQRKGGIGRENDLEMGEADN